MSESEHQRKAVSHHILPTSSNLLGLCFVILSFIKVTNMDGAIILDELVAVAIFLFLVASILSYVSMRVTEAPGRFERAADIVFLIGLVFLAVISLWVVMEIA
jgi:hypothetical protein